MARRPSPGRRPAPQGLPQLLGSVFAWWRGAAWLAARGVGGRGGTCSPRRPCVTLVPPWPAGASARAAVQEANPEADAKDMLKLLAQAWKELSEEEQLKWKGEAEADKARYFAEGRRRRRASSPS